MGSQQSTQFKDKNEIPHSETIKRAISLESVISKIPKRKRDDIEYYGEHETHLVDGSEGEIHTRNVVCEKNPGHTEFIPVDKFTLEHLPEGLRENHMFEFIKAVADLTVRVNVKMVSPHRPEFWPKTNKSYPFYNMRGQNDWRTGSGMVQDVHKYKDGVRQDGQTAWQGYTQCWCKKCELSDSPSNVWWEFRLNTATHVVFDYIEAIHTTLRFFYDNKDSPVVIVDKVNIEYVSIEEDYCRLKCVTCDKNLGDSLDRMWKQCYDVGLKTYIKYESSKSVDHLSFIVSHPHGCTKQVSLGHWKKNYKLGERDKTKLAYTTCTCPGSSGARVHYVGGKCFSWMWSWYPLHVHSGTNFEHKYNYSGAGRR